MRPGAAANDTAPAGRARTELIRLRATASARFGAAVASLLATACASSTGHIGAPAPSSSVPTSAPPTSPAPTATTTPPATATATATASPSRTVTPAPQDPVIVAGSSVWVNVAVATMWTSPQAPRAVDAKALRAPVDIRGWLAAMTTSTRLGLVGRVETQALYGDRLVVTGVTSGWLHVVDPGQPTHRDGRGYPGWVPARQVTSRSPVATGSVATVTRLTTWLHTTSGARAIEVSFGTRLPVLSRTASAIVVATPAHGRLVAAPGDVAVGAGSGAALPRTAAAVLASAKAFLGRPYLWGGRSGFAVDCSGLTSLVYVVHGVVIPRDTDDQVKAGRAASLSALRSTDLLFFGSGGDITHVGFYAGNGQMLHAPRTGTVVQIASMGQPVAARRFI